MASSPRSWRHHSGQARRVFAGLLVALAGVAVFVWSVSRDPDPASGAGVGESALDLVSQVPLAEREDEDVRSLPPELPGHDAGRTFYVGNGAAGEGDGSGARPWTNLQAALCRLRPGDRLAIISGTYEAPLSIDGECLDGAPARPILVVGAGEVTLVGPDTREPIDRPTLTIARSHWRFRGLKIEPQWTRPGILVAPGTTDVALAGLHVLKGIGDGIRIAHGANDVSIEDVHLHHLGTLRGAQRDFRDPATAGILIAPGTSGIRISGAEIHHLEGDAIKVLAPEEYEGASGLPEARGVVIEGVVSDALFGEWN